jgi:hypothetical protein
LLNAGQTWSKTILRGSFADIELSEKWSLFPSGATLVTWHHGCSVFETSNPLKEQQMKLLLATMFRKVPVRKTLQRATLCKRCGTRIYSLSFLKAHLEAHDKKTH